MTKASISCFTPRIPSASLSTIRLYPQRQSVCGARSYILSFMVYQKLCDSVRASRWLRREHAAYMAIPLLALDAWFSQNLFEARLEDQSACGLGFIRSKYDEARNRIHARILNRASRSAALPYPEHGCRRIPALMRSPWTHIQLCQPPARPLIL